MTTKVLGDLALRVLDEQAKRPSRVLDVQSEQLRAEQAAHSGPLRTLAKAEKSSPEASAKSTGPVR